MPFIPVNLDEAQEAQAAPMGRYNLQITSCEDSVSGPNSKNPGSPLLKVTLGFVDNPEYKNFMTFFSFPSENDEPRSAQFKMLNLRRFLELFNVPYNSNGIDTEKLAMDLNGATANCEVKIGAPNPNRDNEVNNELVLPKLRGEDSGRAAPPSRKRR
jgi:hypothetical protein